MRHFKPAEPGGLRKEPEPHFPMSAPASPPRSVDARWRETLGLDFNVVLTLLFRGWSVLAGAGLLFLLPLRLSPAQLGYHYTFASILALQIFFELGMNQVVTQIASHEIAHLSVGADGALEGPHERIDRLSTLVRMLRRWYATAAVLFTAGVGAVGSAFFGQRGPAPQVHWFGPWLLMCASTGANLYLSPSLAMIEGAGRVGEVARLRLAQSVVGFLLTAAVLCAHGGLWASAMVPVAGAAGSALWLRRGGRMIHWLRARRPVSAARVDWRREIFPFQWRIALSWVSGYFIFQLFVPMLFQNQGPVEAGRFGMVLAIFTAVQSIGMSWVYSCGPRMAAHISRAEVVELHRSFLRAIKPSMAFTALACACVTAAVWWLSRAGFAFVHRISSPEVVGWVALVTMVNSLVFAFSVYMRAHKEEPMMLASVTLAVITLAIAHWASRVSVELTAQLYFLATALLALPWSFVLFRRYWKRFAAS
ncbi:MAG: hypothetical protein ABW032_10475 [Burkholderiaceae bacterium]